MKVEHLSVAYGQVTVLENINVTLRKGVLTGIIGPNGAGKSTFFKSACGISSK
nr:ATP-binding cassette domain-containing protein [Brochothrix campestris]